MPRLSRGLYQCHRCYHQTSLTAGTIFHATHLPLTIWFLAIYLLTQRKSGISALQLSRELGVSYNTAWKLKHKLLQVMHERNQGERLSGRIELDDAYLGGERPGKRGRGAEHKFPFVAADEEGHPLRVQLLRVSGFTLTEIRRYAHQAIAPGSHVISDGLGCFRAFDTPLYVHDCHITGGGRASVENPEFNWGQHPAGQRQERDHRHLPCHPRAACPCYLAEFEYRFNRRYDP
ncbi:IS1595 family transposase [Billgrantia gudaonensis]|uniref:ISXO2-like transposase domain-containing protein n=1 Tax=Billgrantia gudaonensis TaxID=376427 RepID=A0A1G8V4K0_9GAMM|nr:IS1595 family transposase [Halomonas gudaonensis]SDJ60971.1 ISXO2-like transposase domain-containing protein [Halomonas gudaonensis]